MKDLHTRFWDLSNRKKQIFRDMNRFYYDDQHNIIQYNL